MNLTLAIFAVTGLVAHVSLTYIALIIPFVANEYLLWVVNAILVYVLVTVGFGVGKEWTLSRMQQETTPSGDTVTGDVVVVYYAHATIRCVSCETIERLTHETLEEQFAAATDEGKLVFKEVNFQENRPFAKQYAIVANCVIVSRLEQGQEIRHERLEKVWDLYENPPLFKRYLGEAIRANLRALPGGDV